MKEKILLHTCCGPCVIYPLHILKDKYEVTSFFYNPNIFPYEEYEKRRSSMEKYLNEEGIHVLYSAIRESYEDFVSTVKGNESKRCEVCYRIRLEASAKKAVEQGYELFSSTLLYSIYMNHEKLKEISEEISDSYGLGFVYDDFRKGWKRGVEESLKIGMYRQKYCGCAFSLAERNQKTEEKKKGRSDK